MKRAAEFNTDCIAAGQETKPNAQEYEFLNIRWSSMVNDLLGRARSCLKSNPFTTLGHIIENYSFFT